MSSQIRFTELVKNHGHPETVTLWKQPKKGDPFMQAVRENRVVTVVQHHPGSGKDFAEIGFHQQTSALYLVFPKPLPAKLNVRVIGLKYELIREPEVKPSERATAIPAPPRITKPPSKSEFQAVIKRTATLKLELKVSARNRAEARKMALQLADDEGFDLAEAEIENEVESIKNRTR